MQTGDMAEARSACSFLTAVEALIAALGGDSCRALREQARAAFEARTGAFLPEDPWFEARSRAFIDDALTQRTVLSGLSDAVPPEVRPWLDALARSHRGLFSVEEDDGDALLVRDIYSGVELYVTDLDESTAIALDAARGLFDARLVGFSNPPCVGALPGPVFHSEESTPHIQEVVDAAKASGMPANEALDALLRMEHKYRSLSRMKPAYAYKKEALAFSPSSGTSSGTNAPIRTRLTKDPDSGT